MDKKAYRLGLIGYPLSHSLSPKLHSAAFKALGLEGEYQLYPLPPEDQAGLADMTRQLRQGELHGLNVTIPHKQTVMPLLDELTRTAQDIGAVNTIFLRDGRLVGENTDAPGFWADVTKSLSSSHAPLLKEHPRKGDGEGQGEKVLVLGAGGAARAVVYVLLSQGWNVTLAVRRADVEQAAGLIESFRRPAGRGSLRSILLEADPLGPLLEGVRLIVNATPVGMSPEINFSPWPEGLPFPREAVVYDLVYNPRETLLVRQARAAGLSARTGLGMLVEQAARSFEIWTGRQPPRQAMFSSVEAE